MGIMQIVLNIKKRIAEEIKYRREVKAFYDEKNALFKTEVNDHHEQRKLDDMVYVVRGGKVLFILCVVLRAVVVLFRDL